jgi:hypothetical protein
MFLIGILHGIIIIGFTLLFCWGLGAYTLSKSSDALLAISFCYTLIGVKIWVGRILRFYQQSEHLKGPISVTKYDQPELKPRQRAWILFVYENRILIPWALVGAIILLVAFEMGQIIPTHIS